MLIGIFSSSLRVARMKMDEILGTLPAKKITLIRPDRVHLSDGTVYTVFADSDKGRGRIFDKLYIDSRTHPRIIDFLVSRLTDLENVEFL